MADLTSEISLSGTINGRNVSFTHTYVLSSVLDAARRNATLPGSGSFEMIKGSGLVAAGPSPVVLYAYPAFALAINRSTSYAMTFQAVETVGGKFVQVLLKPGEFFVLNSNGSNGCWNSTPTATSITMINNDKFSITPQDAATLPFDVIAAYK